MHLYIDIETIPGQKPYIREDIAKTISPPGNIKKPESIAKWMDESLESATEEKWRNTALDGTLGEIICISWAIDNEDPKVVLRELHNPESSLLAEFFIRLNSDLADKHSDYIKNPVWIGHYLSGFDLRFIWQRCVINQVRPSIEIPYNAKPWDGAVFDTKIEWSGLKSTRSGKSGLKSTGSGKLDSICKAFGYEGKGDIDGSKVWDYVKAGKIKEVAEYCCDDVEKTRLLHKRMTFTI